MYANRPKVAVRIRMADMNDQLNPKIGRRNLLRVLAAGAGTVAANASPLAAAATHSADADKKQSARYRANSSEAQALYRVNRYPVK